MQISVISNTKIQNDKSGWLSEVDRVVDINSIEELAKYGLKYHICCGLFFDNKRNLENFREIWFLQYDFDNGSDPESIHKLFKKQNLNHIILASTNHMKDKGDGKGAIPRFHVFLPLKDSIDDAEYYHFLIKTLAQKWDLPLDRQSTDASRYFYRHAQFLYGYKMGFNLDPKKSEYYFAWLSHQQKEKEDDERRRDHIIKENKKCKINMSERMAAAKMLVKKYVGEAVEGMNGDLTTFKAICYAVKCGLDDTQILEFSNWYNITYCRPKWSEKALKHKIKCAKKKIKMGDNYSPKYILKILGKQFLEENS